MGVDGNAAPQRRRFEGWEIDGQRRTLRVADDPVPIGSRAFDLLWALSGQAGTVVSKATLFDAAWPGRVVEENNLSVQIAALRKLLGASAIANVSGVGYKLTCAPIAREAARAAATDRAGPAAPADAEQRHPAVPTRPGGVPRLVGRDLDLEALSARVLACPLVSIVGSGGVGKSVLARRAVERCAPVFRDGVHWLDLSAHPRGQPILPGVAQALGLLTQGADPDDADVWFSLARREALVVLDNAEHLLDEVAAVVGPVLVDGARLRWLLTSQEPLGLPLEQVHRLRPFAAVPAHAPLEEARRCEAWQLFALALPEDDRRRLEDPEAARIAVDVCNAVGGLPLALELAAAQVPVVGLAGVRAQLCRQLDFGTRRRGAAARHHSLLQTYAWTYGLLDGDEQRLFRALQPFRGGFGAEALAVFLPAHEGTEPAGAAWARLAALVDKSLVHVQTATDPRRPPRYALLESARQFAERRLQAEQETEAAERRHAEVFVACTRMAWDELLEARDDDWLARYEPEVDNLRAALQCVARHGDADGLAILVTACALLERFGATSGWLTAQPLPLDVLERAAPRWRARAWLELGWEQAQEGNRDAGAAMVTQAHRLACELGDAPAAFLALLRLVRLSRGRGDEEAAAAHWSALAAIDRRTVPLRLHLYCDATVGRHCDPAVTTERLRQIGRIALKAGMEVEAITNLTDALLLQRRYEETVAVAAEALDSTALPLRTRAYVAYNQAHALVRLGDDTRARAAADLFLRAAPHQAHMLADLWSHALARGGRHEDAALLQGWSRQAKRQRHWVPDPAEAALIAETEADLQATLPAADLQALLQSGAGLGLTQVRALAAAG